MIFHRFYDDDLAQASFLIGCSKTKEALVVDPRRDYEIYLHCARQEGLTITTVAETHIHADYLSGARELARALQATLVVSAEGDRTWQYQGLEDFEHRLLQDGERFAVGKVHIEAIHTPGHTPEHLCFGLYDDQTNELTLVLTGDFLFVGSLGRPDLLDTTGHDKDTRTPAARNLFHSLQRFLDTVPYDIPLWPGHGAGSACGKSLSQLPTTTLGFELRTRPWGPLLKQDDPGPFMDHILKEQPDTPTYFARMKIWNRDGFPLRSVLRRAPRLTRTYLPRALDEGAIALDLRSTRRYVRSHLPGSIHVPMDGPLATRVGDLIPEPAALILITDETTDVDRATDILLRVGHDEFVGFIPFLDIDSHPELIALRHYEPFQARDLHDQSRALLLDVRSTSEFHQNHLENARHTPITRITERLDDLPRDRPLITYCSSGARASIAASLLEHFDFPDVAFVKGSPI